MKTKEELEQIKEDYKNLNKKLAELSEDELKQVTGGELPPIVPHEKYVMLSQASGWKSDK